MGLFKRLVFLAALFCNGVAAQSFASVLTEAPQCAVSLRHPIENETNMLMGDRPIVWLRCLVRNRLRGRIKARFAKINSSLMRLGIV